MRQLSIRSKIILTLLLTGLACLATGGIIGYESGAKALALWLVAPFILLAGGAIAELLLVPQSKWMSRLVGEHAMRCTITIPMLAAPILAALIVALRAGASLHPGLTGALTGAASAGVEALVFAASCPDDSPLFVATWYPLATLICAGVGALAGRRFLAW
jgi:hypothetical protein